MESFACTMVEGLPGSGKTFWTVRHVINVILEHRRPVFTNAPIRFRVLRAWLRKVGGEVLARLIMPLTREHFTRFCARQGERHRSREAAKAAARVAGVRFNEAAWKRAFEAEHGPDVVEGPEANWLPAHSLLVVDEAHHWFPASGKVDKSESPEVLHYLTMHRHHGHSLVVVTQDRMQVSVTFRRLCSELVVVKNIATEEIGWGFRLGMLGLSGFSYAWHACTADVGHGQEGKPWRHGYLFGWLPTQRWLFRLYDSFTHLGGWKKVKADQEAMRRRLGVESERGRTLEEVMMEGDVKVKHVWLMVLGISVVSAAVGWFAARPLLNKEFLGASAGAGTVQPAAASGGSGKPAAAEPAAVPKLWTREIRIGGITASRSGRALLVDGRVVPERGYIDGVEVAMVGERSAILRRGDGVWVWSFGQGDPVYRGSERDIIDGLRRKAAGRGVSLGAAGTAEVVGAASGDAEGAR